MSASAQAVPTIGSLERRYDARIGLVARNLETGETVSHRADRRFGFASTNKAMIVMAVLASTEPEDLDDVVHYTQDDVLEYAPVTSRHVDTGMTLRALCKAAVQISDNTAANLLMDRLGGPDAVEQFLRGLGDDVTNVDRTEPTLNAVAPGQVHDTTTPAATARNLAAIVHHDGLGRQDTRQLLAWMRGNTTGDQKIRAGVPDGWTVADKTGHAQDFDITNDIAVARDKKGTPYVIVVYTRQTTQTGRSPETLIADVTDAALQGLL